MIFDIKESGSLFHEMKKWRNSFFKRHYLEKQLQITIFFFWGGRTYNLKLPRDGSILTGNLVIRKIIIIFHAVTNVIMRRRICLRKNTFKQIYEMMKKVRLTCENLKDRKLKTVWQFQQIWQHDSKGIYNWRFWFSLRFIFDNILILKILCWS